MEITITQGEREMLVMLLKGAMRLYYDRDERVFGKFGDRYMQFVNKDMVTNLLKKGLLQRPAWKTRDDVPRFPESGHYPEIILTSVGRMKAEGRL